MRSMSLAVSTVLTVVGSAFASLHGVTNVLTTLDGNGDRSLDSVSFIGSPTLMTPATWLNWNEGSLAYGNNASFGWANPVPRDMNVGEDKYPGNPDRADKSTPFAGEAQKQGTLKEVFGGNNISHIIDGEGKGYKLDLYFEPGKVVQDDGDSSTIEFCLFERGWNSSIGVAGIYMDGQTLKYTNYIMFTPDDETYAGWKLNTLEIEKEQKVAGAGLSVDMFGAAHDYIGFSLLSDKNCSGPDIVAVRAQNNVVPTPGALALLGSAGLFGLRRRRA